MRIHWITTVLFVLGLTFCFTSLSHAEDKKPKKEEHEKQVELSSVPAAVKATIEKEVGEGKITKVLEGSDTEGGKPTYYEAKFKLGDKKMEVKVAPDGKLISKGDDDE